MCSRGSRCARRLSALPGCVKAITSWIRARVRQPRGRLAAWVAVPDPASLTDPVSEQQHRAAAAAVTDALTTACMLLRRDQVEALCRSSPGVEAWILEDTQLLHFG